MTEDSNDRAIILGTRDLLAENWQIHAEEEGLDWQVLRKALTERILDWLTNYPSKLMTALYVLDIPERVYTEAMQAPTMEERAAALAEAILRRESQKIVTRRRYASPPEDLLE